MFFSGINDLSLQNKLDTLHYKGVFETKDIEPNIDLIHQFSPQTREIWILGDDSSTYRAIKTEIKKRIDHYPKYQFHFISSDSIQKISHSLPIKERTFVILTTIGGLMDEQGRHLSPSESVRVLKKNKNLILCSTEDSYMGSGAIGGYVTSGERQGSEAAKMVNRFLYGEKLEHISSLRKSPNIYMFDLKALRDGRLILSEYIRRNAVIIHPDQKWFETSQHQIMNVLFILTVSGLIVLVVLAWVAADRKRKLIVSKQDISDAADKIDRLESVLGELEEESGVGYWEWNPSKDRFIPSKGLKKLLALEGENGNEETLEVFFDLVHPKELQHLKHAVNQAVLSSDIFLMKHRISSLDGKILDIEHTIHSYKSKENETIVMGIVKIVHE